MAWRWRISWCFYPRNLLKTGEINNPLQFLSMDSYAGGSRRRAERRGARGAAAAGRSSTALHAPSWAQPTPGTPRSLHDYSPSLSNVFWRTSKFSLHCTLCVDLVSGRGILKGELNDGIKWYHFIDMLHIPLYFGKKYTSV